MPDSRREKLTASTTTISGLRSRDTNILGYYSTIGRKNSDPGWFYQVQIQANLFGDTNARDWTVFQTASASGTGQARFPNGRSRSVSLNSSALDDSPDPSLVFRGIGRLDWLDNPGQFQMLPSGATLLNANETISLMSKLTLGNASCSVTWSLHLRIPFGGGTVTLP